MWTLHTDGGCDPNPGNGGIGMVISDPDGVVAYEEGRGIGRATNNIAEYRALIEGLKIAYTCEVPRLRVCSDSKLVVEQMQGRWRVKQAMMRLLHAEATQIAKGFKVITFEWIPREQNERADALAGLGVASALADLLTVGHRAS
jgi:ribonuclease H / adenosylcobalamin/alpha-ribazole phosphatase